MKISSRHNINKNQYSFLKINSPFYEPTLKFFPELKDVFLEPFSFSHLTTENIVLDCFFFYLRDCQVAQIFSCPSKNFCSIVVVNFPETISLKLCFFDGVFVFFVKDEVKDLLCLDISFRICFPEIPGGNLVFLIFAWNFRDYNQLL